MMHVSLRTVRTHQTGAATGGASYYTRALPSAVGPDIRFGGDRHMSAGTAMRAQPKRSLKKQS